MDWTIINALIKPELAGVLAVCWILGYVLKQTPKIPNWSIIYIVTLVSLLMTCMLLDWTVMSIIQGVLCAAVAVFGYQIVKQTTKAAEGDGAR
ncbi:phage holin family protein [Paenibacillus pasadenensis]|nr:phage holin family protein [Paenibacillus pasadenensis]MCM3746512.1 phage holin family protein [Paenibacillus pasadenensis]